MARVLSALRGTGKGAKAPADLRQDHLAGAGGGGECGGLVHDINSSIGVIISARLTGRPGEPGFDLSSGAGYLLTYQR